MFFVDLSYVHATGGHFEHTLWLINLFSLSFDELCVSHHAWCSRWCSITVPYKSMTCDVSFSQGSVITIFRWGGHFFIACVKISSCLHDCWCVQMSLIRRISSRTQWNCQSSPDLLVSRSLVVRSHLILFLYPVSLKTALHRSMFVNILKLILMPSSVATAKCRRQYVFGLSVRPPVHPSVRESRKFMNTIFYKLLRRISPNLHFGELGDTWVRFWGRKVKVHRVHRSHQCKALMAWVSTGSRHISLLSYITIIVRTKS